MPDSPTIAAADAPVPPAPAVAFRRGRLNLERRQHLPAWKQAAFLAGSLAVGLAISVVILDLAGIAPGALYDELVVQTLFNAASLQAVLVQAAPLILVGLGAGLAFRIGFWNLGVEGQMVWGGIAATGIAFYGIGPEPLRLVVMGAAAAIAGLLWVALAAWLKTRFRVNEIISTLLLNYVAAYFLLHLLYGAWQDTETAFPQSPRYRDFERLPEIGFGIGSGLAIALAVVVAAGWLVHLSRAGFYMRFVSAGAGVARAVGVKLQAVSFGAIAISGAAAGLAGFVNVAGQEGRLTQSFFEGYAFSGILIAFLSRNDPLVAALVGFLIAVLFVTGQTLQVFYQIPFAMVQLIQAIIVIAVASSEFLIRHRIRWIP
jgi:simple sugar transport system permease protein